MNHYKYTDKKDKSKPIIFECDAESITEADKLFQKATGKNILKEPFIGCSWKEN